MTLPTIGFAGLTHLGLVSAVGTACKGFRVRGYDADSTRVGEIAAGRLPIVEPELDESTHKHSALLSFSDRIADLAHCDIVYIASDVPTDDRGHSDLSGISALAAKVAPTLGPNTLLCILSQVPPGFTRSLAFDPARLFYQVETLVFGRALERATNPERFIIGCADPAQALPVPYAALLGVFGCPILSMGYESAELAKIAINCCLVASVSVANTLADLSERIGADWHEIAPALRLDRRIGPYSYLAPGLGLTGGNLERDLATVLRLSGVTGSEASVIAAFLENSRTRRDWVLRLVHSEVLARNRNPTFAILGLTYKENTHSTKNSPALALIEHLKSWPLRVYDPVVTADTLEQPAVTGTKSPLDAAQGADAVVIMTPWPQFRAINPAELAAVMAGRVIIDPFRALVPAAARAAGLSYFTLGAQPFERVTDRR